MHLQRGVGALEDEQRLEAWVYRVARTAIADQYRARQRHGVADAPVAVEQHVEANDELEAERALAGCVPQFVSALP